MPSRCSKFVTPKTSRWAAIVAKKMMTISLIPSISDLHVKYEGKCRLPGYWSQQFSVMTCDWTNRCFCFTVCTMEIKNNKTPVFGLETLGIDNNASTRQDSVFLLGWLLQWQMTGWTNYNFLQLLPGRLIFIKSSFSANHHQHKGGQLLIVCFSFFFPSCFGGAS